MERDYFYPSLADREEPRTWAANGRKDAWQVAHDRARQILQTHRPTYLTTAQDKAIKNRFRILHG